jgi:hypothetical protein
MQIFTQLYELPPTRLLSVADIERLVRVTEASMGNDLQRMFSLSVNEASYKGRSLAEVLSHELPASINNMKFDVRGNGNSAVIDLRPYRALFYIHSLNEIWFKEKVQKINEFFAERGPWYALLARAVSEHRLFPYTTIQLK